MFGKYTKWHQIVIYDFGGTKFLLEARRNLKTGKVEFTNTRVNKRSNMIHNLPSIFDPDVAFKELLKDEQEAK